MIVIFAGHTHMHFGLWSVIEAVPGHTHLHFGLWSVIEAVPGHTHSHFILWSVKQLLVIVQCILVCGV